MASAQEGGGARASQSPWFAFVVAGGREEAGRCTPGGASAPAAAADTAAGAATGRAQARRRADARDGGQEARLPLPLPLLLEDIQQEVEVVTEEATVPQQDEEMGGEVEAGADEAAWCAWPQDVLLVGDTVQLVEVVSEEEAVSQQHADQGPGLQVQLMEGGERHGMELCLLLEDISQLVGAVANGRAVVGWAERAPSQYGGPEEEGEEHRAGRRELLELHDHIQGIQLVVVAGHMEGWGERALPEDGHLEQWGEEEEQMAQEKDEDEEAHEDEEEDEDDEDEGEDDWQRQRGALEVHGSVCVAPLAAEPGDQEGWEEWALPEDGAVEEDEAEDEDSEGQPQLLQVHESVQVREVVTDPGQQAPREQWALSGGGDEEEEVAQGQAGEGQREVLQGHGNMPMTRVMREPGQQEGWLERADTGERAVDGEEESEGVRAIRAGWPGEKPRALARVREKALALRRAEPVRAAHGVGPPLEQLEALQRHLVPVNELASGAQSRLKLKMLQSRKPLLELRSAIIQRIPGFWAQAVSLTQ